MSSLFDARSARSFHLFSGIKCYICLFGMIVIPDGQFWGSSINAKGGRPARANGGSRPLQTLDTSTAAKACRTSVGRLQRG